ncbi:MAG: hypothetical protein JST87_07150 [Bacteroidetes bacterium]|nr:hypothetical protein [Bacteroidota bacterium]MBS1932707.1 hypothetical protein [Bacteroidota bacterium]
MDYTKQQINFLAKQFNDRCLPKPEWTHHAHLIIGIWHVHHYGFFDAICRMKSGIILLNNFHQTENTGNSGYHETLTIFWSTIIAEFIRLNENLLLEESVNAFLTSPLSERTLPFEFYTKEKLMSSYYRACYVEPDIQPANALTVHKLLSKKINNIQL